MDSSVAKKTQDTLGKVIKKPPLTEKLLSKPPFRFLHDILTEVIKNTGVLKGLYKADELNSENVKVSSYVCSHDMDTIFVNLCIICKIFTKILFSFESCY